MSLAEEHIQTEEGSPFLPGTKLQYAWDSTSLGWLKTCPRLYQYHQLEGWRSKHESIHLRFGIEYHHSVEFYDILRAADMDHDDALREVVIDLLVRTIDFRPSEEQFGKAVKYKNRETLLRAVVWYLDKFSEEKDPAETYRLQNGKAAVELSFKIELDFGPQVVENSGPQNYLLCGHLDRVVNYNGDLYTMDRKTSTSTLGDYYFEQYSPHNQMTLYTLAGKAIMEAPVKGVIIDAIQLQMDGAKFKRGFSFRNQFQLDEWLIDLQYLLEQNERYVEEDYWPKNDMSCNHYMSVASEGKVFGGCPFRDVCNKPEKLRPSFLKSNFVKQPWNPLKPR